MERRWFALAIFLLAMVALLDLRLSLYIAPSAVDDSNNLPLSDDGSPATTERTSLYINRTANKKINSNIDDHNHNHNLVLPSVACFFMVNQQSTEMAVSVRYSHWGKRCTHFVIVTNNGGGRVDGERYIDKNTLLVDIHHVIQLELEARGATAPNFFYGNHSGVVSNSTTITIPSYTSFPPPDDESKKNLGLKSFYSWMYMTRNYAHRVDYLMKVDPDTYMLMENYLRYLAEYYKPTQHAYIGRVFKAGPGWEHLAFVTGLSVTLSRTTAQYLLSNSAIPKRIQKKDDNDQNRYDNNNVPDDCTAEQFEGIGTADDVALSGCLSSVGVYPSYTRDGLGRERFLHFDPSYHVFGSDPPPEWYRRFSFTPLRPRNRCCSDEACAFHYVEVGRQNETLVWDTFFEWWHWKPIQGRSII